MKKLFSIVLVMALVANVFAGGIVTNTNQSAAYVRTLNRNASMALDAVYFNPAGLMKMENGFYAHYSNQSIFQLKGVESDNTMLNRDTYEGNVKAMIFPDLYLAYKADKYAASFAIMPIGGGGSADYKDGLPSFEAPVAGLVPTLTAAGVQGIQGYKNTVSFSGSSIYLGFQGNISYKINDMVSVSVGGRYVTADNSYEGYLKDVELNIGGTWMAPGTYFHSMATTLNGAGSSLQGAIDAGYSAATLTDLVNAGAMTAVQAATLEGTLEALGVTNPSAYSVTLAQQTLYGAAQNMEDQGVYLDAATADMEVDATQHGFGFCGIFGVNISPNEDLNIGLRYETATPLEMEYDTKVDGSGLFPDGKKTNADMPAMFAAGVSYKVTPKIRMETSLNYYFDENVDWDGTENKLENAYEIGLAGEYSINEKLRASLGYLYAKSAATDEYRTDMNFGLNSNTIGLGVGVDATDNIVVDLGYLYTAYTDAGNVVEDGKPYLKENYYKSNFIFSFGIGYKF